ncbi:Cytochrome P450 4d1 [Eumeta japonica]|uniref:Cytochrome P450 4d1 n=1 Tax=Eumeta variegata TaxID=151549 RepID=A0A4C1UCA1_EUMVA|nr:Cytochrome P450 4d1 [Eumeta japonica]
MLSRARSETFIWCDKISTVDSEGKCVLIKYFGLRLLQGWNSGHFLTGVCASNNQTSILAGAILSSMEHVTKGESYNFLHPWLGQGLLTAAGNKWKKHRKLLTSAFHFNILKTFLPTFYKNDEVFIKKLEAVADGACVDVFPLVAMLALDNIIGNSNQGYERIRDPHKKPAKFESDSRIEASVQTYKDRSGRPKIYGGAELKEDSSQTQKELALSLEVTQQAVSHRLKSLGMIHKQESAMGVSVNAQKDSESEYVKAVTDISEVISKRMRHPLLRTDAFFKLSSAKMRHDQALSVLHRFTEQVVKNRRDALDAAETTLSNYDSEIGIRGKDGVHFSSKDVFHPSDEDTAFACELGQYQKKKSAFLDLLLLSEINGQKLDNKSVREEVDTFMFERTWQYAIFGDGHKRKFEALSISAVGQQDIGRRHGIFHMQRQPSIYEDPLVFKPERFDPAQRNHQNAYNWIAFSAGPRNCIGQKFAMMEMKLCVSSIIRKFKILPSNEDPILCGDLILRSKNGIQLKILPRK